MPTREEELTTILQEIEELEYKIIVLENRVMELEINLTNHSSY